MQRQRRTHLQPDNSPAAGISSSCGTLRNSIAAASNKLSWLRLVLVFDYLARVELTGTGKPVNRCVVRICKVRFRQALGFCDVARGLWTLLDEFWQQGCAKAMNASAWQLPNASHMSSKEVLAVTLPNGWTF